jgi:phage recombination protein Bet
MSAELSVIENRQLNDVLRSSLYPGASDVSIELVKGYCKASGLDVMLKPVHIVPMWSSQQSRMVDTVLPGIGLYRITASRTGEYAGISEPEYGETVTQNLSGVSCAFPEWCKVTVKRKVGNMISEFTAKEYWIENYAVKGGKDKSIAPNAMWMKRPFAQIAKCAEAQALRKAFPEVGSQPTSDEMEGKTMGEIEINPITQSDTGPSAKKMIASIASMSLAELKAIDWSKVTFSEQEKSEIKLAYQGRMKQLKNESVVSVQEDNHLDLKNAIKEATNLNELSNIIDKFPEDVKIAVQNEITVKTEELNDEDWK